MIHDVERIERFLSDLERDRRCTGCLSLSFLESLKCQAYFDVGLRRVNSTSLRKSPALEAFAEIHQSGQSPISDHDLPPVGNPRGEPSFF